MRVVLYGAGQVGVMVSYILSYRSDVDIVAVVDDDPSTHGSHVDAAPVIGGADALPGLLADGVDHAIVCVGDNRLRLELSRKMQRMGFSLLNAIHPTARISPRARLGSGLIVGAGVTLYVNPVIGDCVYLDACAVVSHDSVIGDGALISTGTIISARVDIGECALVGVGANVMTPRWGQGERLRVGRDAIVGVGAAVVRDVPDRAVAVGVPARVIRYRDDLPTRPSGAASA
jgi:UDP-perosamine 4-acetyltransferase